MDIVVNVRDSVLRQLYLLQTTTLDTQAPKTVLPILDNAVYTFNNVDVVPGPWSIVSERVSTMVGHTI